MFLAGNNSPIKNTSYKVVLPFYGYAALSFLIATILMLINTSAFTAHYFNPHTLAITHTMALGWGTMIILGASHQLFPVMIEGKLHSNILAYLSFIFAAFGIPLLVFAFYEFNMGLVAKAGSILINLAVISYVLNLSLSIYHSKSRNVHAVFAFTSVLWLFTTTFLGLLLVWNFSSNFLSINSINFLSLHAHLGIIGWFLLMIFGVGSRLIPMFLISKYENKKRLWLIYALINTGLISFIIMFFLSVKVELYFMPTLLIGVSVLLFGNHIYRSYAKRIRKKVDEQVKISMLSVALTMVPVIVLIAIIILFANVNSLQLVMLYGFTIFFGWITTIILGMTFKTLPFIVWNRVYSSIAGLGKTPNPKELFDNKIFIVNGVVYLFGFIIFGLGIVRTNVLFLNIGAVFLLITAVLYNFNVFKILFHKAKLNEYKNK
ncbi:cytochrome C oxidase subunit I [Gelidibacter gilvus]|uniref:Cytochrome C oxidase subunit I n=1 Tax=Gelidibacter gilvus TaxID=59602 RepID=A0A4Q0XB92_9FLAO|nr:cytochrome C oxidase subunit I [Gelidibacter gilvus]RXJ44331.1 cytochrome C oxidase subunit I [Gelidibacter gilvus]